MNNSQQSKRCSPFYSKVKNEVRVFSNVGCILDKVEQDGNLMLISNTFQQIFQKEFMYAVFGYIIRTKETEGEDPVFRFIRSTANKYFYIQG